MMAFFASFNTPDLAFMPKLDDVFGLYTKMLLGMGVVFQMPTVVFFLAKMKMVTARFLLSNFKYAFLIIFIVAAVITPTGDMMTQSHLRGADGRALPPQHRHRLGRRPEAPQSRRRMNSSLDRQIDGSARLAIMAELSCWYRGGTA